MTKLTGGAHITSFDISGGTPQALTPERKSRYSIEKKERDFSGKGRAETKTAS